MARKYAQVQFSALYANLHIVQFFYSNAMISLGGVALYKGDGQSDTTDRQTAMVISIGVGGGKINK